MSGHMESPFGKFFHSVIRISHCKKHFLTGFTNSLRFHFYVGDLPYAGLSWSIDFTQELDKGLRLPNPNNISDEM